MAFNIGGWTVYDKSFVTDQRRDPTQVTKYELWKKSEDRRITVTECWMWWTIKERAPVPGKEEGFPIIAKTMELTKLPVDKAHAEQIFALILNMPFTIDDVDELFNPSPTDEEWAEMNEPDCNDPPCGYYGGP
ncbi:MAG: hypothetical protein ACYSWP_12845 [Planctomycetota bacterium]|jgi:hypothetical protein